MNVTLAMPADLVADSRRYAAEHGTTLNALIRDLLHWRVAPKTESDRAADALVAFCRKQKATLPRDYRFDRDELHDRRAQ